MTKEELIKIHNDGAKLMGQLIVAKLTNQITDLEYQYMMNNLKGSLSILAKKINSITTVDYSIAKCDCCEEEYILETHTNSKGEVTEEKPFDFTESTPADLFKMGFDSCLKQD